MSRPDGRRTTKSRTETPDPSAKKPAFPQSDAPEVPPQTTNVALSAARTVWLTVAFSLVVAATIALVLTLFGVAGSYAVSAGLVRLDSITGFPTIAAAICVVSAIIAAIVSTLIHRTLVRPMRLMTNAVSMLAQGDFNVRMDEGKGFGRVREVSEFAASFNRAAQELEGTETMRASFISDFSHEFRTPINSISGFAQLLLEGGITPEEQNEYLSIIVEESKRLTGLSERILALSRMEATAILPAVERVDISEQLRRTALMMEAKHADKNIRFNLSIEKCVLDGNADYLMQLWMNLIDNSVKFSPDGGEVSIALYGGRRNEEERSYENDEAVCWISDEGCGMNAATRERIFDKFYQGETSHSSEGNGLGLALCSRIVALHEGSISVQSSEGVGSVFEVRLPLHRRAPVDTTD